MTDEEIVEVVTLHQHGTPIQKEPHGYSYAGWEEVDFERETWDFVNFSYRRKPIPLEWWELRDFVPDFSKSGNMANLCLGTYETEEEAQAAQCARHDSGLTKVFHVRTIA